MGVYSNLKVFHHEDRIKSLRGGEHASPIHVQLVPTNRCNQACEGCAYRLSGYPSNEQFENGDSISWIKLQDIVTDCKALGVKAIQLTGGGEPTVHPRFIDLCAKILASEIDLGVVTNGSRWSESHTSLLIRAKWIRFSIDAGCAKTYASYRRVPANVFDEVRTNLQLLTSTKNRKCVVGVGFVVNQKNWREIVQATKLAKEDGADNFRISALFHPQGPDYFKGFYQEANDLCRIAESFSSEKFQVINRFGNRIDDLLAANPEYKDCGYSKLITYLGANCNVYTCCMNAYNKRGFLGSFKDQSLYQLWNSTELLERLRDFDASQCPRCMYNPINEAIAYVTHYDPPHVNFI